MQTQIRIAEHRTMHYTASKDTITSNIKPLNIIKFILKYNDKKKYLSSTI